MPDKYFEKVTNYNGNCASTIEDHIEMVWCHMEAYGAEHEDMYMRGLFVSLERETCKWFDKFPSSSINEYDSFVAKLI